MKISLKVPRNAPVSVLTIAPKLCDFGVLVPLGQRSRKPAPNFAAGFFRYAVVPPARNPLRWILLVLVCVVAFSSWHQPAPPLRFCGDCCSVACRWPTKSKSSLTPCRPAPLSLPRGYSEYVAFPCACGQHAQRPALLRISPANVSHAWLCVAGAPLHAFSPLDRCCRASPTIWTCASRCRTPRKQW